MATSPADMPADVPAARKCRNPEPATRNRWLVLAILCANLVLVGMDLTVLNVAIPTLSRQLLPTGIELLWIADAYALTVAALLITGGTLGDRIGRKRVLLIGFAVFGLASAAAAFAPTAPLLIAARVALGVGAAMIMATTAAIIRVVFTDRRERTLAIGLWSASHSVGLAVGPILGGLLVEQLWWGAVFLINVPIVAVAIGLGAVVIPESKDPRPRRWDLVSVVLSVVALAGVVYGLKQLGHNGPGPVAIGAGLVGAIALVVFVRRQRRLPEPLLDLTLFRSRTFAVATVVVIVGFGCDASLLFLLTQKFQLVDGMTPMVAGLMLVPFAIASGLGAATAPALGARIGARAGMVVGLGAFAVSFAAIALFGAGWGATASGRTDGVAMAVVLAVAGYGIGAVFTFASDTILSAAAPERAGEAGAVQETAFEFGSGVGVVILGTTLTAGYRLSLAPGADVPADGRALASESLGAALEVAAKLPTSAGEALRTAGEAAFRSGFIAAAAVAAIALVGVALFTAIALRPSHDRATVTAAVDDPSIDAAPNTLAKPNLHPSPNISASPNIKAKPSADVVPADICDADA